MKRNKILLIFSINIFFLALFAIYSLAYTVKSPILRRASDNATITYYFNGPSYAIPPIQSAGNTWSSEGADFVLIYGGQTTGVPGVMDNINLVSWHVMLEGTNVLAKTYNWSIDRGTWKEIVETDILYNRNKSWGIGEAGKFDIESIAVHEFGHWVNLGHTTVSGCVMLASIAVGETRRNLCSDDVEGINFVYEDPMP